MKTKSLHIALICLLLSLSASVVSAAAAARSCVVDADCQAVLAYDLCQEVEGSTERECKHKPLFPMEG